MNMVRIYMKKVIAIESFLSGFWLVNVRCGGPNLRFLSGVVVVSIRVGGPRVRVLSV